MSIRRNNVLSFLLPACLLAAALVAVAGCGGGDNFARVAAQGKVLFDGQPLAKGRIIFVPTKEGQQQATGAITAGDYSLPLADGPSPGSYKVMIYTDDVPPVAMDEEKQFLNSDLKKKPPVNPVGDDYNLATTLTAEFKAGGDNRNDFHVKSRPKDPPPEPK